MAPPAGLFALFPPFDSICALTGLVLVALAGALLSRRKDRLPDGPKRQFPWGWIAAGIASFILVFVVLLLLGLWIDPPQEKFR